MIAQTSWHRQRIETVSVETIDDETIWTLQSQSWGPYIVCSKIWICSCGCDWIEESGPMTQVKSICVACKKETETELFR